MTRRTNERQKHLLQKDKLLFQQSSEEYSSKRLLFFKTVKCRSGSVALKIWLRTWLLPPQPAKLNSGSISFPPPQPQSQWRRLSFESWLQFTRLFIFKCWNPDWLPFHTPDLFGAGKGGVGSRTRGGRARGRLCGGTRHLPKSNATLSRVCNWACFTCVMQTCRARDRSSPTALAPLSLRAHLRHVLRPASTLILTADRPDIRD